MTKLLQVASALSKTMTPQHVADVVLQMGLSAVGACSGALLAVDDEHGEYVLYERQSGHEASAFRRLAVDDPAAIAECARTGRPGRDGATLCLPLLIRSHPIGALAVELSDGEGTDDTPGGLLDAVADQCAQALERARLYALEQLRREELERSNRLKDDFLGVVSHELRTPLSAILGWARMLKAGVVVGDARERALEAIERNATLQARLVDDLLDVSRIVNGKLELDAHAIDLATVVEAAVDSVRPSLLSKRLELEIAACSERVTVLGDARRLQQVVWNLLTNSIKFTSAGGHVRLRLERVGRAARVVVEDTGVGIPGDVLPHVFERFRQADESATRRHGGLGLGLSIVRHVVEAHGGTVWAFSEGPGRGAEMAVELPLYEDAADVRDFADIPTPLLARPGPGPLSGVRVLVVDDDADTREFVGAALQAAGAEAAVACGASPALEHVRTWRPHVIVSDIAMPDEDGYIFLRRVRAMPDEVGGRTPAIALTALARPLDRTRALAAGFQIHIAKPVDPDALVAAVAELIR